jgi:SAM-dependent methyltransferase
LHRKQKADFRAVEHRLSKTTDIAEINRVNCANKIALFRKSYTTCLEIGCESGWFGAMLLDRKLVQRYIGIDFRPEDLTSSKVPKKQLIAADAEQLPLKKTGADLIVAFHVIEHLRNPGLVSRELERIATPGAHIAIAVPLGYDTDPCHVWHFMTAFEWKRFLCRRFGLTLLHGTVHTGLATEFLGLFAMRK